MGDDAALGRHARLRPVRRGAVLCAAVLAVTGCSQGGQGDKAAFCQQIRTDLPALNAEVLSGTPDARKSVAAAYVRVDRVAPSEIATAWGELTEMFEELAALDMASESAFGEAFGAALDDSVRESAFRVTRYVQAECGIDLDRESAAVDARAGVEDADPAATTPSTGG